MNNDADPFSTISTAPSSLARMRDAARESRCVCSTGMRVASANLARTAFNIPLQICQRGHRLAMAPFFIAAVFITPAPIFAAAPAYAGVSLKEQT